ncbi:MAG: OadG family protein [Clostridia bacterium]|nr:OadG family protein [Clostridia bacterium]
MLNYMGMLLGGIAGDLQTGGMTALLGVMFVFVVLAILIVFIELFRVIFQGGSSKPQAKPAPAPAPVAPAPVVEAEEEDEELIAAIMAAVSLCLENAEGYDPDAEYVIRSIRRVRR